MSEVFAAQVTGCSRPYLFLRGCTLRRRAASVTPSPRFVRSHFGMARSISVASMP
jgi:hypothetical protein